MPVKIAAIRRYQQFMSSGVENNKGTHVDFELVGRGLRVRLCGRVDSYNSGGLYFSITRQIKKHSPGEVIIDASEVNYCDVAGVALFSWLLAQQQKKSYKLTIQNLREDFKSLLERLKTEQHEKTKPTINPISGFINSTGRGACLLFKEVFDFVSFTGELTSAFCSILLKPRRLRLKDTFVIAELAGVNAFGIVSLIGFLFGLILAFQAAITLKLFAAEIYTADLVTISLLRVMGPFMTAIIFAARSGSAFAAELGTMKINEEIDALKTMGFEPVRFLAVPRVIAGFFVVPLLSIFTSLFGLIGAGIVMLVMGFPLVTYYNQVVSAADMPGFIGGFVKAAVFGVLISAIGCRRGFQTKQGSQAVGIAATRAVVSGIVLTVIAEGVFAVIYYFLDI